HHRDAQSAQLNVDAKDRAPEGLVPGIPARSRAADELEVLGRLEWWISRDRHGSRRSGHSPVAQLAARWLVNDTAELGTTAGRRHPPLLRGRPNQHHARRGTSLAQRQVT